MSQSNISTWLQFALQQMAAESYLDQLLSGRQLKEILTDGNNDIRVIPSEQFLGKTRFTDQLISYFVTPPGSSPRYQVIDHHASDATGFSATLIRDQTTGEYTLSFRSVEYQDQAEGGDWERDGRDGAAGEVATQGFAFGQLVSMERYYRELKASGKLPENAVLNVTGYSLGAHLATVFTELHVAEIQHTYTFNGAGRGHISGGTAGLSEAERIREMLDVLEFNLLQLDPEGSMFRSGSSGNVQTDARYQAALLTTKEIYTTTISTLPPGEIGTGEAFQKITQLFGHATSGFDTEVVANSGVHGPVTTVLIEGQPLVESARELEFGNSHSITLIVDSLALQELFQTIDPTLTQAQMEGIFKASSDASAGLVGLTHIAEGDTLELALDALRKVFVGPQAPATGFDDNAGGFGDLSFRNQFYANLQSVKDAVNGQTYRIVSLVDMSIETLKGNALLPGDTGTAYRYAVENLNPFAVIGANYTQFSNPGDYDVYDSTTGNGAITLEYLKDRATFLANKLSVNTSVFPSVTGAAISASSWTYYRDNQSSYEIGSSAVSMHQMIFGNATDETIDGSLIWGDRLYGGDGTDTINGKGGDDYIEGNEGNDALLSGGDGTDTILGGQGDDLLDGGTGNDTLDGGLDNDTLRGGEDNDQLTGGIGNDQLEGGAGFDTYIYNTGDGKDRIEDTNTTGMIKVNGQILIGGLKKAEHTDWTSPDGTITYSMPGTDLVVALNGTTIMTVNENFQSGQFGIRLVDLPTFADTTRTEFLKIDHYEQVGTNPDGSAILEPVYAPFFDDTDNDTRVPITNISPIVPPIGDENNLIYAGGGGDFVQTGAGDDQVYGEDGDDSINGMGGNDRLYGGLGTDILTGDDPASSATGNDYLDGGEGNDLLLGGIGADILLGGDGNDHLEGDDVRAMKLGLYGSDYLDGAAGDDELHGGGGDDVLIGGVGNDLLIGDPTQSQNDFWGMPQTIGNDVLDGGSGDDELDGVYGDDLLSGGSGKDLLNGQDGSDVLDGGADNDILSGDLRIKSLGGSQYVYDTNEYQAAGGDDLLFGEDGNDILIGGEGNDTLEGDIGDDSLFGGYNTGLVSSADPLYWTLFTAPGSDWLNAGVGNDVVHGGVGADTLLGEDGNDLLYGGGGDDVLEGGTGDDQLYGDYFLGEFVGNSFLSQITALAGNNWLDGGAGNDDLYGGDKADTLMGGEENDRLFGGSGVDVLIGGDGDDRIIDDDPNTPVVGENETLDGGGGNDYLESWWGDDILLGGTGKDTLVSRAGNDALIGDEGNDRLIWDNTTSTSTQILYGGTGNDVYEIKTAGAEAMELANEGTDLVINSAVQSYTLPDNIENLTTGGTGIGNALDNVINATIAAEGREGNDTLIGLGRLDGGVGDDLLQGGSRIYIYVASPPPQPGDFSFGGLEPLPLPVPAVVTNTYVFGVDYGHDTIQEMDPEFNSAYYQNLDTIEFLSGIAPGDVTWQRSGNNLELSVNGGLDRLTIQSFYDLSFNVGGYNVNGLWVPPQGFETTTFSGFPSYYAHSQIELFTFADGTVWTTDHFGAPSLGDFRADTYRFGRGSGDVTVLDFDFIDPSSPDKQVDILRVGPGVTAADVSVSRVNSDDLVLSIDGTGDRFTMQSFFTSVVVFPPFSNGYTTLPYQIEQVQFDDGTIWSLGDLYNRISTISGTANNDSLAGNNRDNFIQGLDGNDSLYGGGGNDVLDGGAGNDYLEGGTGSDTYLFGRGGGQDTLRSEDWTGSDLEVVQLGGDVLPSGVTIEAAGIGDDLLVKINGTSDQLSLNWFLQGPVYQIDQLVFGDGTVWDVATIMAHAAGATLTGTDDGDRLWGSVLNDVLSGLDGNDVLVGSGGNDRLNGGAGNDDLDGGPGDDTYVFNLGDGSDVIYDTAVPGEGNRIEFGAGIVLSDLTLEPIDGWLAIHVGTGDDTIQLRNFDPTGVNGSLVVSTLQFADGNTVNLAELFAQNQSPTVATPLADQTVQEDTPFSNQVPANTFADPDQGDTLTYRASLADGTDLPAWLTFDAATRTFSGTPDDAQVGSLDLQVTATDQGNLKVSDVFTLTVNNVNEAPTVVAPLANQTAVEDTAFAFTVPRSTFTDVDQVHGDTLTYSATLADGSALATWLTFDAVTRTFSGIPTNIDVGALNLTVMATDQGNLHGSADFSLIVQNVNDAPVVAASIADQTAAEDSAFAFTIPGTTFTDEDLIHGDALTYQATLAGGNPLPTWLSFNPTTRTFIGTPGAGDAGTLQIAVSATDNGTLSATDTFALVISGPLPKTLVGTAGNDVLTGGRGDDTLSGLAGNDSLISAAGNDLLDGGPGTDTMQGGTGNDTYILDASGDVVTELANEGTDTVQSSVTYTLGRNVENLRLTGTAAINGAGNALNNVLIGNNANNTLNGGAGSDRLDGGLGSDTMVGGLGDDTFVVNQTGDVVTENFNEGTDTVESAITYTLGSYVENLTLTGTANINGNGNSANNVLIGNSGANTLDAGSGNDRLDGGDGNDTVLGGSGDDTLVGGFGDDSLIAGSGNDMLNGGDGIDTLDGGSGDDQLLGGAGNDVMTGGSGADQFTGGTCNDTMTGGSGNDLYNFSRGDGQDTIIDTDPFPTNQDRAIFGATINPLDLVISRQANDLRLTIHGSSDQITVQNWYGGTSNQVETLQAGNGQILLNTQVGQLIQAMASFSQQTGLTWDQAIDQRPQDVQTVLAASWH